MKHEKLKCIEDELLLLDLQRKEEKKKRELEIRRKRQEKQRMQELQEEINNENI